jgi:hypothetical protein
MLSYDLPKTVVQLLAVFMQNHGVRITVKFLEGQARVVLLLYFLDGAFEQRPYVLDVAFVHGHLEDAQPNRTLED